MLGKPGPRPKPIDQLQSPSGRWRRRKAEAAAARAAAQAEPAKPPAFPAWLDEASLECWAMLTAALPGCLTASDSHWLAISAQLLAEYRTLRDQLAIMGGPTIDGEIRGSWRIMQRTRRDLLYALSQCGLSPVARQRLLASTPPAKSATPEEKRAADFRAKFCGIA